MAIPKRKFCPRGHDKETVGILGTQCRECRRVYQKEYNKRPAQKQAVKKWSEANKSRIKDSEYRRTYGISLEDYNIMSIAQNNLCSICKEQKPLVVDHDHKTKIVRGLLCGTCNRGIGYLKDSSIILGNAIAYLFPA